MSTQRQQRDNSGILFRNDRKTEPQHADYSGSATINGQEFWMNAWLKEGRNGKFMSFSFKPKKTAAKASADVDYDDAIPF